MGLGMVKFTISFIKFILEAVDKYLQQVSAEYKANRFYQDCRKSYVPGDIEWNHAAQQALLLKYGYKEE